MPTSTATNETCPPFLFGVSRRRCENESGSQHDLAQSVFRGSRRQVQGSNGLNPAQLRRPLGSTQILPPRHIRVKHSCQSGHAVIKARGVAHTPRVDSREDRIRLLSEKGRATKERMNRKQATLFEIFEGEELKGTNVIEQDKHSQQHSQVNTARRLSCNWVMRKSCIWCCNNAVSFARRQSGELYSIHRVRRVQQLVEPLSGHGAIWCRDERQRSKVITRTTVIKFAVEREHQQIQLLHDQQPME